MMGFIVWKESGELKTLTLFEELQQLFVTFYKVHPIYSGEVLF